MTVAEEVERLTLKAYAARRGVTPKAVRKAIGDGRLEGAAVRDERGRWSIDADLADELWAARTDPSQQRGAAREYRPELRPEPRAGFERDEGFAEARARRESWQADLAALRAQVLAGDLCDAYTVRRQGFEVARRVRNHVLSIPSRVSTRLAAETDHAEVHRILTEEITLALHELAGIEGDTGAAR